MSADNGGHVIADRPKTVDGVRKYRAHVDADRRAWWQDVVEHARSVIVLDKGVNIYVADDYGELSHRLTTGAPFIEVNAISATGSGLAAQLREHEYVNDPPSKRTYRATKVELVRPMRDPD